MSPRKNYGPPIRQSQRVTNANSAKPDNLASGTATPNTEDSDQNGEITVAPVSPEPVEPAPTSANTEPEEPVEPQSDTEQDQPVDSIEVDGSYEYESVSEHPGEARNPPHQPSAKTLDGRNEIPKFPSRAPSPVVQMKSEMADESENTAGQATITQSQLQDLLATIAQLKDQLATRSNNATRQTRGITPLNSAFGGAEFKPHGIAARTAFKPYGSNQNAKNPAYDRTARKAGIDPGMFDGDKDRFDKWITKIADKFVEDDETYKTERSRMAVINSLTEGLANDLIQGRYKSTIMPFSSAAEMVATLAAVYHDDNQASKAREELRHLKFSLSDKSTDIHQFIGKVNSLADKANIAKTERKLVLYEHIPANLNPQLLSLSKDPNISYETFAGEVANSALAQQRAWEELRENRKKREERRERSASAERKQRRRENRRHSQEAKNQTRTQTIDAPKSPSRENAKLVTEGRCFLCKEAGHLARNCPQKAAHIAAVLALQHEGDREACERSGHSLSSSDSENC